MHKGVVGMSGIADCQEGHGGEVRMRVQFDAKDDRIASVPSSSRTRAVEKHVERARNAWRFTTPGSEGQDRQRGWGNPTDSSGNPRPAGFRWIEANLPIEQTKLPLPQPVRL